MTKYGSCVYDQVRRVSRSRSIEALEETNRFVWRRLVADDLLNKFAATALSKLPSTLPLSDALGHFGITLDQLREAAAQAEAKLEWVLRAVQGFPFHLDALYSTGDLGTLDLCGFLPEERLERRRREVSDRGFKSYLSRAVQNHFKARSVREPGLFEISCAESRG
jgi:hypothetical protein